MKIERELYMRISSLTGTDYSGIVLNEDSFFIEEEDIKSMIKDLIFEIGFKDEKIEDLENDIRNNYVAKKIDPYYEYGVSERDFH